MRQKLCICFEPNSVFVSYGECWGFFKKIKEQKDKLIAVLGNGKMKCFSISCDSSPWPYFFSNENLRFLKFGQVKNYRVCVNLY